MTSAVINTPCVCVCVFVSGIRSTIVGMWLRIFCEMCLPLTKNDCIHRVRRIWGRMKTNQPRVIYDMRNFFDTIVCSHSHSRRTAPILTRLAFGRVFNARLNDIVPVLNHGAYRYSFMAHTGTRIDPNQKT